MTRHWIRTFAWLGLAVAIMSLKPAPYVPPWKRAPGSTGYVLPWNREPTGDRVDLAPGEPGPRFVLSGRVYDVDGRTPLGHARMYVYHADAQGNYARPGDPADIPRLAGVLRTSARGEFFIHSVLPGVAEGPPHIHVRISSDEESRVTMVNLVPYPGTVMPRGWSHVEPHYRAVNPFMAVVARDSSGGYRAVHDFKYDGMTLVTPDRARDSLMRELTRRWERRK